MYFQIDTYPDAALRTAGCLSICRLQSAILASAFINRSSVFRFRGISIAALGVDFIALVIGRRTILWILPNYVLVFCMTGSPNQGTMKYGLFSLVVPTQHVRSETPFIHTSSKACTRASKKSALFFQFIYTNVGLKKYVIFLHSLLFRRVWSSGPQASVFPPRRFSSGRATICAPLPARLSP